jgi:hypothetical protein
MTKLKHPRANKKGETKSVSIRLEEFSGTLENWIHCRQERIQAQLRLLESCRTVEEIDLYKAQGILDYKGTTAHLIDDV